MRAKLGLSSHTNHTHITNLQMEPVIDQQVGALDVTVNILVCVYEIKNTQQLLEETLNLDIGEPDHAPKREG